MITILMIFTAYVCFLALAAAIEQLCERLIIRRRLRTIGRHR